MSPKKCAAFLALALSACTPVQEVTFEIPREGLPTFLQVPWPSDLLRSAEGLDLSAFPNPTEAELLDLYIEEFESLKGYSGTQALYFKVEGGVDPDSLPKDAAASLNEDASAFLVRVKDPSQRIPISFRAYNEGSTFVEPGTVAALPLLGWVVDEKAALVVTDRVRTPGGAKLGPSADMRDLSTCRELPDLDSPPDCADYQAVREGLGLSEHEAALIQVYTPMKAADALVNAARAIRDDPPPPQLMLERHTTFDYGVYNAYAGRTRLAIFQKGRAPYHSFDGDEGRIFFEDDGRPTKARDEEVSFILTVPKGPVPSGGWPVVIIGHGTGGSLTTGLGDGDWAESHVLSYAGWATLATSEPHHAGRTGYAEGSEELLTFNFLNPVAGRDNWRQSVLEKVQLVGLVKSLEVSSGVGASGAVQFNPDQVAFFGHSQGGIVGAMLAAVEPRLLGLFLSGAGAGFGASTIEKVEPVVIADVVRTFLNLDGDEPLDIYHPITSLLQLYVEPSDPVNYGAAWRKGLSGGTPHLVATAGLKDAYTPKVTQAGLAGAFELPIIEPEAEAFEVLDLKKIASIPAPAQGNDQDGEGNSLTTGILQYPDHGHFAVYQTEAGWSAYRGFFDTLRSGVPSASGR
jgi:pimeloyl-ACP methyl ester carboxylesterase